MHFGPGETLFQAGDRDVKFFVVRSGLIETDAKGFVLTGPALTTTPMAGRQPFLLETSRLGVFAVGDVRAGSVKRVASAVGEGSMAVQFVHAHLKRA